MRELKYILTFFFGMLVWKANTAKAQILVPEDLQTVENTSLLHTTDGKLWSVSRINENSGTSLYAVSAKAGNSWKRFGSFKAVMQSGSKAITFTDIEVFADVIYLSGDFGIPGTKNNCLITFNLGNNPNAQWKAEYTFTANNNHPMVSSLALAEDHLYIAGNFEKLGNLETNHLAKFTKTGTLEQVKVSKNSGCNGPVQAMESDTLRKSLFIAGNFKVILGQASDGFVRFRVLDSNFMVSQLGGKESVVSMRNIGSTLMIATGDSSSKEKKVYFYREGALKAAPGLDSIYEVTNFFLAGGIYYFSGSAKPEVDVRGTGIFQISSSAKAKRVYRKFGNIFLAESYQDNIYVTGNFQSVLGQKLTYTLARIDDNYQRFYGRVFYDRNNDGIFNGNDIKASEKNARISPYNGIIPADDQGYFTFIIPKGKSQTIKVTFDRTVEMAKSVNYIFNADTFTERLVLFPLTLVKANFSDIRISISAAAGWKVRKDTSELYVVRVSNNGVVAANPDINLQFNGKIVLIKPFPAPDIINPGKITWEKQSIQPGEEKFYLIKLTTPSSDFSVNDQVHFTASTANMVDDNPVNNTDSLEQTVSNGVQLNAKFQYPAEVNGQGTSVLSPDAGKIEYIIRFSNTTNDTIHNVVVVDTINTPDYVTYIQETGASHSFTRNVYTTPLLPDKVVVSYTFTNVNLPPNPNGNTEQVNSSGYIGFRLGLETDLPAGTALENTGFIFMDNNNPLTTNTVTAIVAATHTHTFTEANFSVFPNPFENKIQLQGVSGGGTFYLTDMQGRQLLALDFQNPNIDLSSYPLSAAPYAWKVVTQDSKTSSGILIKK